GPAPRGLPVRPRRRAPTGRGGRRGGGGRRAARRRLPRDLPEHEHRPAHAGHVRRGPGRGEGLGGPGLVGGARRAQPCACWRSELIRLARCDLRLAAVFLCRVFVLVAMAARPCSTFWYLAAASKSPAAAATTAF